MTRRRALVRAQHHAGFQVWLTVRPAARSLAAALVGAAVLGFAVLPAGATRTGAAGAQASAGTVRIAAEEEPACADWISSCAGSVWGQWTLGNQTLPQAFSVNADGDYAPGAMLASTPTLDPGPPMKVTYRIRPEAVWSDGEPITSKDFEYTWKQIVGGKDIYDTTGYADISAVDTTDPKVAVVTFKETFAPWRDLFGSTYYVLPSHLLDGKNRHKIMKDGYTFSAGPWKLDGGASGWQKGKTITLVPNDKYWGTKPTITKVVFQFIPESAAEFQAIKSGQVLAAYPLPQDGILDQLNAQANLTASVSFGNSFEAMFLNHDAFPLDSAAVRQAVVYATDRQAVVDQVLKPSIKQGRVLQSFVMPTFKQYYMPVFSGYSLNQAKVDSLMTGDGWTRTGGVWTKNGRKAALTISTTTGNQARSLTEQLWQSQMTQAGFSVTIKNQSPDVLFNRTMPQGRYSVILAALTGTPDPELCSVFCSKNIPSKSNGFSGLNITRTSNPTVDTSWQSVQTELNPAKRITAVQAGQSALAADASSIPLYQSPSIFVFDKSHLGGKIEDNTVMGPFFTMNEWTLK